MQNYKFLNHIVLCNVFFAIICIPTAGKLIDVMGCASPKLEAHLKSTRCKEAV